IYGWVNETWDMDQSDVWLGQYHMGNRSIRYMAWSMKHGIYVNQINGWVNETWDNQMYGWVNETWDIGMNRWRHNTDRWSLGLRAGLALGSFTKVEYTNRFLWSFLLRCVKVNFRNISPSGYFSSPSRPGMTAMLLRFCDLQHQTVRWKQHGMLGSNAKLELKTVNASTEELLCLWSGAGQPVSVSAVDGLPTPPPLVWTTTGWCKPSTYWRLLSPANPIVLLCCLPLAPHNLMAYDFMQINWLSKVHKLNANVSKVKCTRVQRGSQSTKTFPLFHILDIQRVSDYANGGIGP
ncbi:hypothetical protein Btru_041441, partial [Bulinus truncatus]